MKISLNNTILIENYLLGNLSPADRLLFEIKLMLNRQLRIDMYYQQRAHLLIKMYHRKKLKEEFASMHDRVLSDPKNKKFRENILCLFKQDQR